jgi:hypothetical protein
VSVLPTAHLWCLIQFGRAKLEESMPDNEEQSRVKDTTAIELARSVVKKVSSISAGSHITVLLEGERQDISHLVTIREAHQTR